MIVFKENGHEACTNVVTFSFKQFIVLMLTDCYLSTRFLEGGSADKRCINFALTVPMERSRTPFTYNSPYFLHNWSQTIFISRKKNP